MDQAFEIFYFETENGRSPIQEFIDQLDSDTQEKLFSLRMLLQKWGPRLSQPHSKHLGRGVYELKRQFNVEKFVRLGGINGKTQKHGSSFEGET